jgi:hypothetical protein
MPKLTLQITFDVATYINISLCFNNELNSCGPRISIDCILFGIPSTWSISLITLLAIPTPGVGQLDYIRPSRFYTCLKPSRRDHLMDPSKLWIEARI